MATIFVRRILPIKQLRRENSSRNVLFSVEHRAIYHRQGPSWFAKAANSALWNDRVTKKVTDVALGSSADTIPKPVAYKVVRVYHRRSCMWTKKWSSMVGEIRPVRWETEERRKRPISFATHSSRFCPSRKATGNRVVAGLRAVWRVSLFAVGTIE
jgi:hypothetical protein